MTEIEFEALIRDTQPCASRDDLLSFATWKMKEIDGLVLEFGVRRGTSLRKLAKLAPHAAVYGFDSWDGLPEEWVRSSTEINEKGKGACSMPTDMPNNVRLIQGLFEDTLPKFVKDQQDLKKPRFLSLVHIDCDLYSSTRTVLENLKPIMDKGCVLVFDELMDFQKNQRYHNWREHEWKALIESELDVFPIARTTEEQVAFVLR